ncbi:DNA-3-methyladenine glycosylase family protein [Neolewinella persica]|uniref:DNA-3-methyladenine glycosylase family protein n=1 Tax=Neolewinella persica TaxID=70998 RepID=UPI00035E620D|nr:DNA-3-methyladenine glycosylase [Neolewinella persica]
MLTEITNQLSQKDPVLAAIIPQVTLPDIAPSLGIYHDLVSCIVDQQIPQRTRGTYMKKLIGLLSGELPNDNNIYTIQEEDWAIAKMANPKYHTLFRVTDAWHAQKMDTWNWQEMTDKDIRDRLQAIKGIGPQTVDMILLYTLTRPDVFPVGDYHLKQIMEDMYEGEKGEKLPKMMTRVGAAWAPYRSFGTRYLLAWKEERKR